MTTYTEATGSTSVYSEAYPGETTWDLGATSWDVAGDIANTDWDFLPSTVYTESSSNTPTWVEQ